MILLIKLNSVQLDLMAFQKRNEIYWMKLEYSSRKIQNRLRFKIR
jgi:hypothetical protein